MPKAIFNPKALVFITLFKQIQFLALTCPIVLLSVTPVHADNIPNGLRYALSFDHNEWNGSQFNRVKNKLECRGKIDLSVTIKRAGTSSARFEVGNASRPLVNCGMNKERAEIIARSGQSGGNSYPWDDGRSHWIGFSVYPKVFDAGAYSLMQIHAPNNGQGKTALCEWDGNAITLRPEKVRNSMNYSLYVIKNGHQALAEGGAVLGAAERVWTAPMDKTEFTDFVLNFSLSTQQKGYVKMWVKDKLVVDLSGLTNVHSLDSCGKPIPIHAHNGPHIGIYGPPLPGNKNALNPIFAGNPYREIYVDELRTATGPDGHRLVNPNPAKR